MKLIKNINMDIVIPNFTECNDSCSDSCCADDSSIKGSGTTLYTSKNRGNENPTKNSPELQ